MDHLLPTATDADIIGVADRWAALLEADDYQAACDLIGLAEGTGGRPTPSGWQFRATAKQDLDRR